MNWNHPNLTNKLLFMDFGYLPYRRQEVCTMHINFQSVSKPEELYHTKTISTMFGVFSTSNRCSRFKKVDGMVVFLVISFLLFSCEGQITSPPDGSNMTVLPGSTVNITWSFNDDVSQVSSRAWYFTSSNSSINWKLLAGIIDDGKPRIYNSGFSGVSIIKPATLLLKNVNQTYGGTYRFVFLAVANFDRSDVVVFIAVPPAVLLNCSSPITLKKGEGFICECQGTDGNPPANVTWYKDNTKIITGKKEAVLSLRNVGKDDNGTYRCEARTRKKAKNKISVELIVILTPVISVNCSSPTTVIQGDNIACECKGTDGNPPADVTWYRDNTKIVTEKEEAILVLSNVDKDDSGTYRCEAKSHEEAKNETFMALIVNYLPENVRLMLTRSGQSATITCTAEARPKPSFKIFLNETTLVISDKTYTIPEVNNSRVGYYKCVAENVIGQRSSNPICLCLEALWSNSTTSGTEWYIIVVTLVSGIIIGILLSYIAWSSHRRWCRNRKPKRNPDQQPTEADSTYQGLDLSKMNKEDNYQSLRGNVARINDVTNDDDSNYTELSKTRDDEDKYQSLT